MRLFEWESGSFREHRDILPEFIDYLSGVWENRNRYIELDEDPTEEERQEERLQRQRFFDFTVDGKILARNYVGVVQFEGIRIEVYPKIFAGRPAEDVQLWQTNLLYWLTYCRKIKFPFSFADVTRLRFDNYLELLIYIFANYAEEVLGQQPFQAYQATEEETGYLKGRLAFENYTKRNLTTGRWQYFQCIHEPFVYDNLFNRIVKYVTRRLQAISENPLNREKLSTILFLLDDVSDVSCTAADCDRVQLNPLYADHTHILNLCRMYLSNQVIDMDAEDSRNFCFLIPMEYIFEDFIFGFLSAHWPHLRIESQSQDWLALRDGNKVFQIRNDLFIERRLIVDTKYKIRDKRDPRKAGVSQSDLYQMVSYALRRNVGHVLLLYPATAMSINEDATFIVPSQMLQGSIEIGVKNIDITFESIQSADSLMRERLNILLPQSKDTIPDFEA